MACWHHFQDGPVATLTLMRPPANALDAGALEKLEEMLAAIAANPEARSLVLPERRYGFIPGWGTLGQLVSVIGQARTTKLLLTGRALDAGAADSLSLLTVHRPAPNGARVG